jgi:hypothetical protein
MFNGYIGRVFRGAGSTFLEKREDLVDFGGKEIEGCENSTVGSEVVRFHYFFVVYAVANIDIAIEGNIAYGGIKVNDVWRCFLRVQVRVYALHEGGFARAWLRYVSERIWEYWSVENIPAMPTQTIETGFFAWAFVVSVIVYIVVVNEVVVVKGRV